MWNVGTWYLGLPASSSHTLIGSIIGVGLMQFADRRPGFGEGVNWGKVEETVMALVTSPMIGFVAAALLLLLARLLITQPGALSRAQGQARRRPGGSAQCLLTCTGVSFAHGSNDGQKGMGLIMLMLIGAGAGCLRAAADAAAGQAARDRRGLAGRTSRSSRGAVGRAARR